MHSCTFVHTNKNTQFSKMNSSSALFLLFFVSLSISGTHSTTFTIINNCGYTVWPGILSNAGSTPLATTGFSLQPGESRALSAPVPWSGRFWGRTLCATSPSGQFSCQTGDCGSGQTECNGGGAAPPASLAEFTLGGGSAASTDFYDLSLVDGYNLPMLVVPQSSAGGGTCAPTGCLVDLNGICPAELRVMLAVAGDGEAVACKSACEAFDTARYCCSGEYGNPNTCGPTAYSQFFKNVCPRAYSYAYDDATSTFTCATAATPGYTVTFCPTTTSLKSGGGANPQAVGGIPLSNSTMVFSGYGFQDSGSYISASPLSSSILYLTILITCILLFRK